MREIKFRGLYNPNGTRKWVYGGFTQSENGMFILPDESNCFNVDKSTVGQFTGLRDKNGMEIYEGDIIKFVYHFRDKSNEVLLIARLENLSNKYDFFQDSINSYIHSGYEPDHMEIIGNIYDNPELIKKVKESFR